MYTVGQDSAQKTADHWPQIRVWVLNRRPQRWEASVLPLCHHYPLWKLQYYSLKCPNKTLIHRLLLTNGQTAAGSMSHLNLAAW